MSDNVEGKSVSFAGALGTMLFLIAAMAIQVFVLKSSWTTHITLIIVISVIVGKFHYLPPSRMRFRK